MTRAQKDAFKFWQSRSYDAEDAIARAIRLIASGRSSDAHAALCSALDCPRDQALTGLRRVA